MPGSIPAEDEGFYVAFTRSRFVLSPAGVELDAFRPDLLPLAGCGGSRGGLPGIALDSYRCLGVGLEIVVPGRVLCAAKVGRDEAHAVGVRDSEHRDGARLPRFGAGGGEDDRRQADRDPSEATLAAGQLGDELVEMVCGRAEERPPTFVAARLRIIR